MKISQKNIAYQILYKKKIENRISNKEIKNKNYPTNKILDPGDITIKFSRHLRKKIINLT